MKKQAICTILLGVLFTIHNMPLQAQNIIRPDGTPVETQYCWEDTDYPISGEPAGGTFDGCGVFEENGQWYFNPQVATERETVFPISCQLTYTVDGQSTSVHLLIWKPVVIDPPLNDSFTCTGEIRLEAYTLYAGAYDYQWIPSAPLERPDTSITNGYIMDTTTFILTATDHIGGCMGSDTVTIAKYPEPDLTVTGDTTINAREPVLLQAAGATQYVWTPPYWLSDDSIANPLANPQQPITYQVVGINTYGCSDTAEITIDIREDIFIPNAFTPNGDGVNDVFRIENYGYQQLLDFRVFNRWGQLLFAAAEGIQAWDGRINGEPAAQDTYFYSMRMVLWDGQVKEIKGDVLLIR